MKPGWVRQLGIMGVVTAIGGFLANGCVNRAFYIPKREMPTLPVSPPYHFQTGSVSIGDETLSTWTLEPMNQEPIGTVLFSHGNAGNLEYHLPFVDFLPLQGYRVVLYDYRGYGISSRRQPTRTSTHEDLRAMLRYTHEKYGKPWLYGHSLGACISICVAAEDPLSIRGVVAISPFTTYREIARHVLKQTIIFYPLAIPFSWFVPKGSDPIEVVDEISPTPLLLVHPREDEIIPYWMVDSLYKKAGDPCELLIVPAGGHNDDWRVYGPEFVDRIIRFLHIP